MGDEDEAMESFQRYAAYARAGEGLAAMLLVDHRTIDFYEHLRDLALFATEEELATQPLAHQWMALRLRASVGAAELATLDGRSLIGLAIERRWVGLGPNISLSDIGRLPVLVNGDEAELQIPGPAPANHRPRLRREHLWRVDLSLMITLATEKMQAYFDQAGQSRREFLVEHLQNIDGLRVDGQIWQPPLTDDQRNTLAPSREVPLWARPLSTDHLEARALLREVGQTHSTDAVTQYLVRNLQDGETEVRLGALKMLTALGDRNAGHQVLALLGDHVAQVRAEAIDFLMQHADDQMKEKAVPELVFMMRDRFPSIFLRAANALGRIRDERARADLESWAMRHADADMREACVMALGALGARQSLATILRCLRDPTRDVRVAALVAAKDLEGVDENQDYYESVVRLSEDEDTQVAERACEILVGCQDLRGLTGLVKVMERDQDELRRYSILLALANAGDPRVVPLLQQFTTDQSSLVRDQAFHVIKLLSGDLPESTE